MAEGGQTCLRGRACTPVRSQTHTGLPPDLGGKGRAEESVLVLALLFISPGPDGQPGGGLRLRSPPYPWVPGGRSLSSHTRPDGQLLTSRRQLVRRRPRWTPLGRSSF